MWNGCKGTKFSSEEGLEKYPEGITCGVLLTWMIRALEEKPAGAESRTCGGHSFDKKALEIN